MAKKGKPSAYAEGALRNLNVQIDRAVLERVRDAVVHLQGAPLFMTLSRFVEGACEREIERLALESSKGKRKSFPSRPVEIRRGRPIR
jgi:hypothetical protein